MKKNLISIIILALVVANFVLTALLVFTVLPQTKQANELISKVCSAIDLDLNSGSATGLSNVPIDQVEIYQVNEGATFTANLASGPDKKSHYVVLSVSLSLNTNSENFSKYTLEVLKTKDDIIRNDVNHVINKYTKEEFNSNTQDVQNEILELMQEMFGSDYVIAVNFSQYTTE